MSCVVVEGSGSSVEEVTCQLETDLEGQELMILTGGVGWGRDRGCSLSGNPGAAPGVLRDAGACFWSGYATVHKAGT